MGNAFGIDLGTTYSCIAKIDDSGTPSTITIQEEGKDTMASAVFFESENNVIVGGNAKEYVETDGDRVVQFVKRKIGKLDPATGNPYQFRFFDKDYEPVAISAMILKRLKEAAEMQGMEVKDVVITCPAYFGLEERNATKDAGVKAGLNVLGIINEPTAAALNYCSREFMEEKNIMVYDLGGGTFDVTIVKLGVATDQDGVQKSKVSVLATDGDDLLGGADWDERLYGYIADKVCEDIGIDIADLDAETKQTIRSKTEETKKKLSTAESAKVKVKANGSIANVEVTRAEFEQMTSDLVAKTMTFMDSAIKKAEMNLPGLSIDTVLLVGGSTYMPMIRNAVEARFPGKVRLEDPDRAVAKGAAIYANETAKAIEEYIRENPDEVQRIREEAQSSDVEGGGSQAVSDVISKKIDNIIEDQTPRSFGVGVVHNANGCEDYACNNVIFINTKMPSQVENEYYLPADNMSGLNIEVFENVSSSEWVTTPKDIDGNPRTTDPKDQVKCLGDMHMELAPGLPARTPVKVLMNVSSSGIYVKAFLPASGQSVDVNLEMAYKKAATSNIKFLSVKGE